MYIQGLIPRNFAELAEAVPIGMLKGAKMPCSAPLAPPTVFLTSSRLKNKISFFFNYNLYLGGKFSLSA